MSRAGMSPEARAVIDAARAPTSPSALPADARARIRAGVRARIAAGAVGAATAVAAAGSSGAVAPAAGIAALAAKVLFVAAVAGSAVYGVARVATRSHAPTHAHSASVAHPSPRPALAPPVPRDPPAALAVREVPVASPVVVPVVPPAVVPVAHVAEAPVRVSVLVRTRVLPPRAEPPTAIEPADIPAPEPAVVRAPSTLPAEIAVGSEAQVALTRGDPQGALAALARGDAAGFVLRWERDALRVRALCALGREADARAVAAVVLREAPRTPSAAAIRHSCAAPEPR